MQLTQGCAPLGARTLAHHPGFWNLLEVKQERPMADECKKLLASYRREELTQMRLNFYGSDPTYHEARRRFVYKSALPHHAADLGSGFHFLM